VGLLDEHKLSIEALGARYCTDLNPDRPEQSRGMDQERAGQVRLVVVVGELGLRGLGAPWPKNERHRRASVF